MAGHFHKYTPEIVEEIVAMIGRGTTVRVVCQKVDIHIDTYKGWLEKYPDFRERVKNAREQKAEEMLKIIEDISYAKTELWY